jgi:hypothetical protein
MARDIAAERALARRLEKRHGVRQQEVPIAERVAKLPGWARTHIATLERHLRQAEQRADALAAAADEQQPYPDTDTVLDPSGHWDLPQRELPPGSMIIFGGRFEVSWGMPSDVPARVRESRRPALYVSSMDQIEVLPLDGERILIREVPR